LVRAVVVTVLIDLPADHTYHLATLAALEHASEARRIPIDVRVVRTDAIRDASRIATPGSAVVIGPGSPYCDLDAAHDVVRKAREWNVPLVGT
jgi:CTP synthase (UTP-ammonia lyase)